MNNKIITEAMIELLKTSGSPDISVAKPAMEQLVDTIRLCIQVELERWCIRNNAEFIKVLELPSKTNPPHLRNPPSIGNPLSSTIDWKRYYSREGRWDIVGRVYQVFESGIVRQLKTQPNKVKYVYFKDIYANYTWYPERCAISIEAELES
jgi:hypothetical protein